MNIILKNLSYYRSCNNFSKTELGKLIGKDTSIISKLEKPSSNPTLKTILKLCEVLHTDPNSLIGFVAENNNDIIKGQENEIIELFRQITDKEKAKKMLELLIDKPISKAESTTSMIS